MILQEIKETRLKALEHAYQQQMKVLNKDLDVKQVDPEKMNTSLKAYKTAAEESDFILGQIIELTEELKTPAEKKADRDKEKVEIRGLSPEARKG